MTAMIDSSFSKRVSIMTPILTLVAALCFAEASLGGAKSSHTAPAAKSTEKVRLALNWKPEPQFGGFYAARLTDVDKKNGIEFDLVPGGAGTPVVQMVAAGQFDFGIASADEVVVSRARGSDIVALFAVYQTNPQAILTHAERSFDSLSDVFKSGGTIAMQKGLPYAVFLSRKYANGSKASIVPYLGGISNFLARPDHSQQCFVTSEPFLARKQGAKVKTFLVADSGFNPYTTVVVTRRSMLKEKPELVKNVVASVREGWRRYLDQPDETNAKMNELNPSIDLVTFRQMSEAQRPLIEGTAVIGGALGAMTAVRWSELSEQLESMKVIESRPESDSLFVKF
jgi:NitT/TauT family transport system substrate-binding protein